MLSCSSSLSISNKHCVIFGRKKTTQRLFSLCLLYHHHWRDIKEETLLSSLLLNMHCLLLYSILNVFIIFILIINISISVLYYCFVVPQIVDPDKAKRDTQDIRDERPSCLEKSLTSKSDMMSTSKRTAALQEESKGILLPKTLSRIYYREHVEEQEIQDMIDKNIRLSFTNFIIVIIIDTRDHRKLLPQYLCCTCLLVCL